MFTEYFNRSMTLLSHTTSLPVAGNSITLDPEMKDAWGLPAIRVTYDYHPDDAATMQWIMRRQLEILEAAGGRKTWSQPRNVVDHMPSRRLMGTGRMGKDPAASVVNRYSRAHDRRRQLRNLGAAAADRHHPGAGLPGGGT